MAGVLRRLFKGPNSLTRQEPQLVFEADWSAISPAGLGLLFKELLADLIGAPHLPEVVRERLPYRQAWQRADVSDIYFQKHLLGPVETGFLVRGVIYDMPALIQLQGKGNSSASSGNGSGLGDKGKEKSESVENLDVTRRDWSTLLDLDTSAAAKAETGAVESVSADQVLESLGLKAIPGLRERVGALTQKKETRQSKLEQKQALEEIMGTGDSIRAKYANKVRQKKMVAEARREQAKLGIIPTAAPKSSAPGRGWCAMPGAPALVRYMQERGLVQALLARGEKEDVASLLDQLGNFQFQQVNYVRKDADDALNGEALSNDLLQRICASWGLPSKQIMVVIGEGSQSEAALAAVGESGFYVCRVQSKPSKEDQQSGNSNSSGKPKVEHNRQGNGLVSWFNRLAEGTLHVDEGGKVQELFGRGHVHFSVSDMVELKWVIEDLNGVSYRRSALISGFGELGKGARQ